MSRFLLPSALLLALTACPGSSNKDAGQPPVDAGQPDSGHDAGKPDSGMHDAGPPDAGFQNVTVEQWCLDLATAQCWRDERCLAIDPTQFDYCLTRYESVCDQLAYTRGVHEGRLQFLSGKAGECLNGLNSGSCSQMPGACAVVFSGLVAPDAGCILPEECDNSGYCFEYDYACPHHCRPFLPMGASCDGFSLRCKPDESWCGSLDGGYQYNCWPFVADGLACPSYESCRPGSVCNNGTCVQQTADAGETCGVNGGYPYCTDEYFCRQDLGQTTPPPGICERKGGVGELCNGYYACLPSLRCTSTYQTGTCAAKGKVGDACSNFTDCEDGLFCDPPSSKCAVLPEDGGDCTDHGSFYTCHVGYFCDFNAPNQQYVCTPLAADGLPCSYDGECLSNSCQYATLPDGGFGGTCVASCAQRADGGF